MTEAGYSDSALVLLGHGTTKNAESRVPVYEHAAVLRNRGVFASVLEAFWKQEPYAGDVLRAIEARRVFIMPMFLSEGYFCEWVIPRELGFRGGDGPTFSRIRREGGRTLFYCRPVGVHEAMTGVVLHRAEEVLAKFPFPRRPEPGEISLFLAGHGTERNPGSRSAVESQVKRIQALAAYHDVHAVFMEEDPRIAECYQLARTGHIVMVPYFMGDGLHANEDIPMLLGEPESKVRARLANGKPGWRSPTERQGKLVWYGQSVGTDSRLTDVIVELVKEACGWEIGG